MRRCASLALACLLFGAGHAAAQSIETDFAPDDPSWSGLSSLIEIAATAGVPLDVVTELDVGTLTPADAIVVVAPVDPPPAAALTEFMRRGGRVLVADDFGASTSILDTFGIVRSRPRRDPDVLELRGNPELLLARPAMQHPLTHGVDAVVTNHAAVVHHPRLMPVFEIAHGDAIVLAGEVSDTSGTDRGGRLVVLSDPSVLINNMLAMRGNHRFAENLLSYVSREGGRVYLVPPHARILGEPGAHGTPPLERVQELIETLAHASLPPDALRFAGALVASLLLLALFALPRTSPYGSSSFAPRPAAVGGFVGRVGWYASRSGDLTEPLLVYKFELENELHTRLGLTGRSPLNHVIDAMQRRRLSRPELDAARALLVELARVAERAERSTGDAPPVSEAQLRDVVARGDALLAKLGGASSGGRA